MNVSQKDSSEIGHQQSATTDELLTEHAILDGKYNIIAIREALVQVNLRLVDLLDTKKNFEQKATTLFGVAVSLTTALLGGAAFAVRGPDAALSLALLAAAAVMSFGAIAALFTLQVADYGALGSHPNFWLVRSRLGGDDQAIARSLAEVLWHHKARVEQSEASNRDKLRWLTCAWWLTLAAPLIAAAGYFIFRMVA